MPIRPRVEVEFEDRRQFFALTVAPLPPGDRADPLFIVVFKDLGAAVPIAELTAQARDDLPHEALVEQFERDIRDLREQLQSMSEENDTATEELKSANEEMVSVNEELQSVNEELRVTNIDLSNKVDELDQANDDLRNLFNSTQVATVFLDRHLVIRSFTPAVSGIFDLIDSDRGRPLTSFANRLDRIDLQQEIKKILETREAVERRITARDGQTQYLMRILPYTTLNGTVDGVVLTFVDITKVVESELLGTLVDELNHRVPNMLQVVSAVASHTLRRSSALKEFGTTFAGRIRALGHAHELVSRGGWSDVPLLELILKELEPYATGQDRIATHGEPVRLKPKAALALGMILHELATNATKHGGLSTEARLGTILFLPLSVLAGNRASTKDGGAGGA